jgi:hypothetical protein
MKLGPLYSCAPAVALNLALPTPIASHQVLRAPCTTRISGLLLARGNPAPNDQRAFTGQSWVYLDPAENSTFKEIPCGGHTSVTRSAFTATDLGLLRSVLAARSPVPKCEAFGAPFIGRPNFHDTQTRRQSQNSPLQIPPPFRHGLGFDNHVSGIHQG